jgi:hypothetical protein
LSFQKKEEFLAFIGCPLMKNISFQAPISLAEMNSPSGPTSSQQTTGTGGSRGVAAAATGSNQTYTSSTQKYIALFCLFGPGSKAAANTSNSPKQYVHRDLPAEHRLCWQLGERI